MFLESTPTRNKQIRMVIPESSLESREEDPGAEAQPCKLHNILYIIEILLQ